MSFDKIKLRSLSASKPIEPKAIFNSLTLRGNVENLWAPQSDALADWHAQRELSDVTIEMSTGGGKTLVGLLIAQSLVNQTSGQIVYACPTNQLVEQTAIKAAELGLSVATYTKGTWVNKDAYFSGTAPCITSYAAAFHSFSKFGKEALEAIIIDDAHVAAQELKGKFTLTISDSHLAFTELKNQLQPLAISLGKAARFEQALSGDPRALVFLPAFTATRNYASLERILAKNGIAEDENTKFAWGYLNDKLDRCLYFVGSQRIEISPPLPPFHAVAALAKARRRIYLTATLPSPYEAARVFGKRIASNIVRPSGKLGAAQKLVAFILGENTSEIRENTASLIARRKACIIVPRKAAAKDWPAVQIYNSQSGEAGLNVFRQATAPAKLILAGRFDGIDLPGDTCRILVLDGLPRGSSLLERFLVESVRSRELRAASTAMKIVQAIGRIFRSNTDHGVVLVCGDDLQNWLMDTFNQGFLPPLLQKQVRLGGDLRSAVQANETTFQELVDGVLTASPQWDDLYTSYLDDFSTSTSSYNETISNCFLMEHEASRLLWDGSFAEAKLRYQEAAKTITDMEPSLAGWFQHLAALCAMRDGDDDSAGTLFYEAAAAKAEFGRPPWKSTASSTVTTNVGDQTLNILSLLNEPVKLLQRIDRVKQSLRVDVATTQQEEAIADLGRLLGLESARPDKESGTGPDCIWMAPWRSEGVSFEAITGKKPTNLYTKDEIGQCHDHEKWLLLHRAGINFTNYIVGPHIGLVPEANPDSNLKVIELDEFQRVAKQFGEVIVVCQQFSENQRPGMTQAALRREGLLWPQVIDGMESRHAVDLQSDPPTPEGE